MFGYFKLDRECPREIFTDYKKYYCFLCRTLQRYYGLAARFTLSYDVAFFLILVSDDAYLGQVKKVSCLNRNDAIRQALEHPTSKTIASLNILLSAAKLEDDICDEKKLSSRIVSWLLSPAIRKAKKTDPLMWEIISDEYATLRVLEAQNAPLHDLEDCFARMMLRLAKECFGLADPQRLSYLQAAARWLYFIDAVDDVDENRKEGSFNPFASYGSFHRLKNHNYLFLTSHIHQLYADVSRQTPTGMNDLIINRILFRGIPDATVQVLTRRRSNT